jgi:predicted anti-sigma-YlaC factor YlaD
MGSRAMMTCHEVSRIVSEGTLDAAPWRLRLGAWLHFAICRQCRAFARQVAALAIVAKEAARGHEPDADFDARLIRRLELARSKNPQRDRSVPE